MAFNASKVVEALRYDLRPYVEAHGVVPEPTDDELREFNRVQREMIREVTGDDFDPGDNLAMARAFNSLTDAQLDEMQETSLDALAAICKGNPTREQLKAAGPRVRTHFLRWLAGELNPPEGSAPATRP